MEDFYWYELEIKDGYVAMVAMERQISGKDLYTMGIGYHKQDFEMNKIGCFIFCEDTCNVYLKENIPLIDHLFVNIIYDAVKNALKLFKEPIDRMPLLINKPGIVGIIAKYRLENNI